MGDYNKELTDYAVRYVRGAFMKRFGTENPGPIDLGCIVGTGFANVFESATVLCEILMGEIPGFGYISVLEGHPRKILLVKTPGGKLVLCQVGRIHMNEDPAHPEQIYPMARLQVELMIALGVKKFIFTCACGSLHSDRFLASDLVVIDGFVTAFANRQMTLWAGEFVQPDLCLDEGLQAKAIEVAKREPVVLPLDRMKIAKGCYLVIPGPPFAMKRDLPIYKLYGDVIGMSQIYEAAIVSLHGQKALFLGLVTDDESHTPNHEEIQARAKLMENPLSEYLSRLFDELIEAPAKA